MYQCDDKRCKSFGALYSEPLHISGDAWLDLATLGPALRTRVVPVRHAAPHLDEAAGQTLRLSSAP